MPVYLDTEDFFYPAFSDTPYLYRDGNFEFSIEPYVKGKGKGKGKAKEQFAGQIWSLGSGSAQLRTKAKAKSNDNVNFNIWTESETDENTINSISTEEQAKPKRDWPGIAAILLSLSMIGAVTAYTVYTVIEVLFN